MADNNEYKLTITLEGGSDEESTAVAPSPSGNSNETQSAKNKQSNSTKKNIVKGIAIAGTVFNYADRIASGYINTVTLRTGFEEQQAKYQFGQNIAKQVFSVGTSMATGFLLGNVPGMMIGLVASLANTAISWGQQSNQVQIARENENTQIFLNSIRMGAGANRGNRE